MTAFIQDHVPVEPRLVLHNTQEQATAANLSRFAQQARELAGNADAVADSNDTMPLPTPGGGIMSGSDSDSNLTDEDDAVDDASSTTGHPKPRRL